MLSVNNCLNFPLAMDINEKLYFILELYQLDVISCSKCSFYSFQQRASYSSL